MKIIRNEKGTALILVILMVSIIVAVTIELNASSRSEVYEAANFRDRVKTLYIAKSGFNAAAAILLRDNLSYDSLNEIWAKTEALSPYSAQLFEGEGACSLAIEDESGKIPVHKIVSGGAFNAQYREIFERFLSLPEFGLSPAKVAAIINSVKDWIDADEEATGKDGAESVYYRSLTAPYSAKNDRLDSLDELLLVKEITPEIFFGSEGRPGIRNFLTVYGESGKININTAPRMVLRALSADMSIEKADAMDEYRRNPLNSLADSGWYKKIDILSGVSLGDVVSIKSGLFRISSTGILSDMRESVSGVVERTDNKKMRVLFWKTGI